MSEYLTDEEQAERLKQWWKENGRSIVVGVVVGLGVFGGWQGWQKYQTGQEEGGSAAFDAYTVQSSRGALDAAMAGEENLRSAYPGTAYADFAALDVARKLVEAGRLEEAAARLRSVHDSGVSDDIRQLARIRLARVLLAMEALDETQALLDAETPESFAGEIALLKGDLARQRGDATAARAAYEEARELGGGEPDWLDLASQNLAENKDG